jgi:hypothetical protein
MRDELDDLIDGAIAEYSAAEPLAGLEQRVLNHVRLARPARRPRWWCALALVAPGLAAAFLLVSAREPAPSPIVAVTAPRAPVEPLPPAVVPATPKPPAKLRRAAGARVLPKRGTFPTLSPLSREERLLVQLADSRPQLLLAQPVDEVQIKPIEITPLQIDGGQ